VGVTWLDRRNDPANIDYEAYASFSTNGGVTFSTNKNLATAASNPLDDGFNGYFMGDYTGNSWYGTKLYMAACDTRNGAYLPRRALWILQRTLIANPPPTEENWSPFSSGLLSLISRDSANANVVFPPSWHLGLPKDPTPDTR